MLLMGRSSKQSSIDVAEVVNVAFNELTRSSILVHPQITVQYSMDLIIPRQE